jgi:hypothetical protein
MYLHNFIDFMAMNWKFKWVNVVLFYINIAAFLKEKRGHWLLLSLQSFQNDLWYNYYKIINSSTSVPSPPKYLAVSLYCLLFHQQSSQSIHLHASVDFEMWQTCWEESHLISSIKEMTWVHSAPESQLYYCL